MNKLKCLMIAMMALVLSSCVMTGQKVELNPLIRSGGGDAGRGREVVVTVVDARGEKTIGVRDQVLGKLTSITAESSLTDNTLRAVAKGLTEEGFKAVAAPAGTRVAEDAMRKLTVEIASITYLADLDSIPKKITCTAEVKAVAVNNGHGFERTFRITADKQVMLTPSEADNETAIADALSDALTNAVTDYELMTFLSKEMLRTKKIEGS